MESKVELYYDNRFLNITLSEISSQNWNLPMNENKFKIYKNSNTIIQFIMRNNDRKPLNLSGKCLFITVNDEYNTKTLLHKCLDVIDEKQGLVKLITRPYETQDWPVGNLTFNVSIDEGDGKRLLYLDQMETARGFLQVCDGPYVGPRPSQHITNFTPIMIDDIPTKYRIWSDVMAGSAKTDNYDGVQTISTKLFGFTGNITIYLSLEKDMPQITDPVWFPINTKRSNNIQAPTTGNSVSYTEYDQLTVNPNAPYPGYPGTGIYNYYDHVDNFFGNIHYNFTARNNWTIVAFDPLPPAGSNIVNPDDPVNAPIQTINEIWYRN